MTTEEVELDAGALEAAKAALLELHSRVLKAKRRHVFTITGSDFNVFLDALLNGAIAIERLSASRRSGAVSQMKVSGERPMKATASLMVGGATPAKRPKPPNPTADNSGGEA